ncbi:MAG: hypothetical protein K6F23_01150 [Solobacterium sp.]|nr:hypothetical protein [Solobacterium sp.]
MPTRAKDKVTSFGYLGSTYFSQEEHCINIMHALFSIEDSFDLRIHKKENGTYALYIDPGTEEAYPNLYAMFASWEQEYRKFKNGEITEKEYLHWKKQFPDSDPDLKELIKNADTHFKK